MKLTFFFIAVCFAAVANQSLITSIIKPLVSPLVNILDGNFVKFLLKYSKIYDVDEILQREAEYLRSLTTIRNHNSDYDEGLLSYTLRENKFCDLSDSERQRISTGNRNPPYEFADFTITRKSIGIVNNTMFPAGPPSVDWRTSNCISPVKDQGYYCNNCWAFSSIASLEAHWCIKTGQTVSLSEQQAVDCNRNDQTGNWGCDGGSMASCYMYISGNDGIASDATYPYQEATTHNGTYSCRYSRTNKVATTCGYWRIRPYNEDLLKNVVAHGPVAAAMYASLDTFYFYGYGIYDDPKCQPGTSHSVLIVGYGTENGIDYWLCKNSWSTDWGDKGYFKIRRGLNRCGITGYLIYPDVCY